MKILIATGIYPPKIGGPAQYAKNLKDYYESKFFDVHVATYSIENYLPTGIRHIYYFLKILPKLIRTDLVLCMDSFSTGFPAVFASKLLRKKSIIRLGGDFFWDMYNERTNQKISISNFYKSKPSLTLKEKIIFKIVRWTLNNSSMVVFSTDWQRKIFVPAYNLNESKIKIIENFYGNKEGDFDPENFIFIGSTRPLKIKNLDLLNKIFLKIKSQYPNIELFLQNLEFMDFMEKLKKSYAVIQVSVGDVSPNMILDAIRYNKPFICTTECGLYDRIKDIGIFVDPSSEVEIENAILRLLDKNEYKKEREKIRNWQFVHTWNDIGEEFLNIYKEIK